MRKIRDYMQPCQINEINSTQVVKVNSLIGLKYILLYCSHTTVNN
jgi:hypothetical protein